MSYAQRKELSGNRTLSIIFTIAVVGSLMYGIVTGLAYNVIKKAAEDLKTFDVEEQPPPPEEPPPPPKDMPDVPPPPTMPPSIVQTVAPPPTIIMQVSPTPPITPPAPPAPPAPPPPRKTQSATSAKGDLRTLFSNDDYPASALAAGAGGTAQAELTVGPDGRVTGCNLVRSTGNGALDSATCNILRRRAKFIPARDSNGNPTSDTIRTPSITWVVPPE